MDKIQSLKQVAAAVGFDGAAGAVGKVAGADLRSAVDCIRVIQECAEADPSLALQLAQHIAGHESGYPKQLATRLIETGRLGSEQQQGSAIPSGPQMG